MKRNLRSLQIIGLLVVLLAVPVRILIKHYSPQSGFLALIDFGQEFRASRLEEVSHVDPPTKTKFGYDGQFYAQIALNPFLTRDDLERALDNPTYRSRRVGLPFLAFCLGLGKPTWILQVYALLNFVFWLLLLVALGRFIGYQHPRDVLLAMALLWSTGTLSSVERALTDLPAAVLGVLAVFLHRKWITSAFLLGSAALFKESSALSFAAARWRDKREGRGMKRILMSALIMVFPITLWVVYVQARMTAGAVGGINALAFPLSGLVHKFWEAIHNFAAGSPWGSVSQQVVLVFEVLCPLSLVVQAAYLLAKPRFDAGEWRLGIGFALLLCMLGRSVWVEQYAYCRALLPLTFSFNILLYKDEPGTRFAAWYLAGNVGMCRVCLKYFFG